MSYIIHYINKGDIIMAQINIRVDDKTKSNAEKILENIGLNMSTAINVFFKAVIRENGIPFQLKNDVFYSEENIKELERRVANIKNGKANFIEHDLIKA